MDKTERYLDFWKSEGIKYTLKFQIVTERDDKYLKNIVANLLAWADYHSWERFKEVQEKLKGLSDCAEVVAQFPFEDVESYKAPVTLEFSNEAEKELYEELLSEVSRDATSYSNSVVGRFALRNPKILTEVLNGTKGV